MSGSSKDEGAGVSPQNKGSWATFVKVRKPRGCNDSSMLLIATLVDSIIQWRPLFYDSPPFHPRHHFPHRVLGLLDRTSIYIRCASFRTRPCKAGSVGLEMVFDYVEVIIQQ